MSADGSVEGDADGSAVPPPRGCAAGTGGS